MKREFNHLKPPDFDDEPANIHVIMSSSFRNLPRKVETFLEKENLKILFMITSSGQ